MPDTPPPITVWSEDVDPSGPPPRTDPPRHVQQRASEVYERVAGGTGRRRRKPAWWGYGIGMGLLLAGGVVAWFRLDAGLMHTPTLALVVGGLAVVVKAVLGYR
jgi:hypothetical protein